MCADKDKIRSFNFSGMIIFILTVVSWAVFLSDSSICAQEKSGYDPGGRRDPFLPLISPEGTLLKLETQVNSGGISLEGVIYDKSGESYAIVDSKVVKVGDTVGDWQVLKIEQNKVIFQKDGQVQESELKKEGL
jgi:hypothetical protein